ncbi:hypothetical protein CJ030_MR4G013718 [Morella rubra]|uniref:Uncharacterized protein n=1 Tax=Morella rubra TaxID=262757 RepID=A0A6A1WTP2_9ROSI|nr:hypothetical protein CJ030_MR4G013718 [Morella rubra]
MSSGRFKRTTHLMPSSVSSRARKRGRGNEEPPAAPEPSIYKSGLEQKRLGKSVKDIATSVKTTFEDIKKLVTTHIERFGTLDKYMRGLKHQVNNNIHVASMVIQNTVDEFKATSAELQTFVQKSTEDVVLATKVHMNVDRNLHPHVLKWTYWFSITWMEWLKKFEV